MMAHPAAINSDERAPLLLTALYSQLGEGLSAIAWLDAVSVTQRGGAYWLV